MKNEIVHIYPATSLQQGFIYHALSQPEDDAYRVQVLYDYHEALDIDKFIKAWNYCIEQYPILRTAFNWEEDIFQLIYKHGKLDYQIHEISNISTQQERDAAIETIQVEDRKRSFDLTKPTLFRLHIIKQAEDYYTILKTVHHSITDGWSMPVLLNSFHQYYHVLKENKEVRIKEDTAYLKAQDYIYRHKGDIQNYWDKSLAQVEMANDINALLSQPIDVSSYKLVGQLAKSTFEIKGDVYNELKNFCKKEGITLNVIVQFIWHKLLQVYSGSLQSIVGTTISGRDLPIDGIEESVGLYINTLPLIINWENENTIQDQLLHIQHKITELNTNSFANLAKLQKNGERIFHTLFVFENYPVPKTGKGTSKVSLRKTIEKAEYPINILAHEHNNELKIMLQYDDKYLTEDKVKQHTVALENIIHQIVKNPTKSHKTITLLNSDEYDQIIYRWNDTGKDYPKGRTIHQLIQEQAKTPGSIALAYEQQKLTYKDLNEKSNQLARHIREQYQKRAGQPFVAGTLIALYLDRGLEAVVGMLAVMKAGGAYVPLDTSYPQERVDYIMEDTQAELVLSLRHLTQGSQNQLPQEKIIHIDLIEDIYVEEDKSNLQQYSKQTDLIYVIYTSGTTGKPKGVELTHKGLTNLVFTHKNELGINGESKVLQYASLVFDASVIEIFSALPFGAELSIVSNTTRQDASLLSEYLEINRINIAIIPPVLLSAMPYKELPNLSSLIVAGESCPLELMIKWSQGRRLINAYGPTENSVCTTMHTYEKGDLNTNIGKPIDNIKAYVLDNNLIPVPVSVTGELYVGGAGLARGYLKRPDLTGERFVPNPFATEEDLANGYTRLYKTGDLVRWLPNGDLEFLGRNDSQVKIRGYRIELGEIEHAMTQISGVKQSCVLAKERKTESGNDKYLAAYCVLDSKEDSFTQAAILDRLSRMLPEYMVPSVLVFMEAFPMTVNGKLDKRALPDPEFGNEEGYVRPETDLEIRLCKIYAEVLGLESDRISTQQNFFRMGGNSILSIRLKQKLNQLDEFKQISVADLFKHNTINKLIQSTQQDHKTEYKLQNSIVHGNNHEVAIIGISGAFSGVSNVTELWQLIANQREGIQFYSKDECRELGIDETLLENPNYIPVAGKVKDIELFDPLFWEISPNEAKLLDPQIRKFIEHCWFALESSGYTHKRRDLNIGVFAGSGNNSYFSAHIQHGEMVKQINLWDASISNSKDALTTKTAFLLGLSGPAISINTACSTGLVSVVEACKNLCLGTCNMALAGGVSLSMPDQVGYMYQEGMISSKDGHCRTFDKEASGTTGGSGVGVVLLKRLEDAIKDDDPILGVIKGYASNNDGDRKTGYTAPSVIGQSECIINAQQMAGVTSDQIDYVECHGTATNLGDPIEVQALREAFEYNQTKENRPKRKTILGALKANIGHADSAAGIAGLIKVCAMLQNSTVPGQVNFHEPNPELHLNQTSFEILKENRDWLPYSSKQRLAGVSSFGVGGTNAHVILGDYTPRTQDLGKTEGGDSLLMEEQGSLPQYIIPISAKSRQSLERYRQVLTEHLTGNHVLNIQDITYTLQEMREHFNYRSAYCARNTEELIRKLRADVSYAEVNPESNRKVVFMFPGQGAQYTHMAKALYDNEQPFRDSIDQCIAVANRHLDVDLFDVMYPREETSPHDINELQWTQVSLFTIEYALAKYLEHLGVKADAYIGHSIGEYVAATLAGVFTLEDAIKVVIARGKLMQTMQPGSMLAINAREEVVKAIVEEHECEVAVINSNEDIAVSGTDKAITALEELLEKQNVPTVKLKTSHAGHSRMMDRAANEFEGVLKDIKLSRPTKYFASNLTGEMAKEEVTKARYWCEHLRNTVQFAKGVDSLSKQYNHQVSFIEVGTGKGLSSFVNKYKHTNSYKSIQTLQLFPSAKEVITYQIVECKEDLKAILWMSGIIQKPNESKLFKNAKLTKGLPLYQFDYQKCWINKSNNILADKNKNKIINKFNDEIDKLSILTKESVVNLLEKLLTPDKENVSEDIIYRKIRIMEENYSETEFQIAQIIADILGVDQISMHDDFFRIGGNSIIAIQVSHRISKALGCNVKVADIFQYKTINGLLEKITLTKVEREGVELEF